MPWCEDCAKYWAPSAMTDGGECPTCGRVVEAPAIPPVITAKNINIKKLAAGEAATDEDLKTPWHFKLLMVMLTLYFVWRIIDLFR